MENIEPILIKCTHGNNDPIKCVACSYDDQMFIDFELNKLLHRGILDISFIRNLFDQKNHKINLTNRKINITNKKRCFHGKIKSKCIVCNPKCKCIHGVLKYDCKQGCLCIHKRLKRKCSKCNLKNNICV